MNTTDMISRLSEKSALSKVETKDLYNTLTSIMHKKFAKEGGIAITRFGNLKVKLRKSRIGFNPSDEYFWKYPKRLVLTFSPSLRLKKRVE